MFGNLTNSADETNDNKNSSKILSSVLNIAIKATKNIISGYLTGLFKLFLVNILSLFIIVTFVIIAITGTFNALDIILSASDVVTPEGIENSIENIVVNKMEIFRKKIDGLLIIIGILTLFAFSWWFVSNTSSLMLKGQNAISKQMKITDDYKYDKFVNNATATGDDIKNLINSFKYEDRKAKVTVNGIEYGWISNDNYKGLDVGANDRNNDSYISSNKRFYTEVIKNNNDVVTEIVFTQNLFGKWELVKFSELIFDFSVSEIKVDNYFTHAHSWISIMS